MNKMSSKSANIDQEKVYLTWLKNKFKTLEKLNEMCKGNFTSFNEFIECSENLPTVKDDNTTTKDDTTQTDTKYIENEYYDANCNTPNIIVSPRRSHKEKNKSPIYIISLSSDYQNSNKLVPQYYFTNHEKAKKIALKIAKDISQDYICDYSITMQKTIEGNNINIIGTYKNYIISYDKILAVVKINKILAGNQIEDIYLQLEKSSDSDDSENGQCWI